MVLSLEKGGEGRGVESSRVESKLSMHKEIHCSTVATEHLLILVFSFVQVTQSVYNILSIRGYTFECRGLVAVKGKGKMVTYWMTGKEGDQST